MVDIDFSFLLWSSEPLNSISPKPSVELDQEISILSDPVISSTQLKMEAVELPLLTAHPFQ